MDAITYLRADHQGLRRLFRAFEQAGDRAHATKRKTAQAIVKELSGHAAVEEQIFYPAVRHEVADSEDEVLESLEEHHVAKWLSAEIDKLDPSAERFDAKVTVLIESVRHHMEEEERELFPKVRDSLGRRRLVEIGELMEKGRALVPTRPHPRAPDTPPANLAAGMVAAVVDKARDHRRGPSTKAGKAARQRRPAGAAGAGRSHAGARARAR